MNFEAFLNQQDIGWDQALCSRISHNWGQANAFYCQQCGLPSDFARERNWLTKLVSELWTFGADHWKSHNQHVYGATDEETTMKLGTELDNAISALYASSAMVAPTDRHLFLLPSHIRLCHHNIVAQKL